MKRLTLKRKKKEMAILKVPRNRSKKDALYRVINWRTGSKERFSTRTFYILLKSLLYSAQVAGDGREEEEIEVERNVGKRLWRFNEILITLLVSGHSPLSFVLVHEKLNCRTWYPWKASPSKSVVIYERVQLINISGPAFNGLRPTRYVR